MADNRSDMHKQLDILKDAMMVEVIAAVTRGLPPLGALTATLAVVEEQIAAMYRGAALKERLLPSAPGEANAVDDYISTVRELLAASHTHATELGVMAKAMARGDEPSSVAQQEISVLEAMLHASTPHGRKPS